MTNAVALIAIIIAIIGVVNTILMSVFERTSEIGVMKAVGAREKDILEVFLIESGSLGLIGGGVGIVLGTILALVLNQVGVPTKITLELLGFSLAFSFAVGMISGLFPARMAAELEPVAAMRFE